MPRNFTINYARIVGAPTETPTDVTLYYIVGHYEPVTIDKETYNARQFSNQNRDTFFISQPHQLADNSWVVTTYTDNPVAANSKSVTVPKVDGVRPDTETVFSALAAQEGLDKVADDKIFFTQDIRTLDVNLPQTP